MTCMTMTVDVGGGGGGGGSRRTAGASSVTHFQEQNIDECNDDGMCTVTLTRGKLLYDIRRP